MHHSIVPVVSLKAVSAGYDDNMVIEDLTLDIKPGISILLGVNGSGKTTLFRLIAGVLDCRSGKLLVRDKDPTRDPHIRGKIGYVGHRHGLVATLTGRENLIFWGKILGLHPSEIDKQLSMLTEIFEIPELIEREVQSLSRGQIQRIVIVRSLLGTPHVLLLDEPGTGLDPLAMRKFLLFLKEKGRDGMTILYSTHNIFEAQQFRAETIIMSNGKIVAKGYVDELCQKHLGMTNLALKIKGDPKSILEKVGLCFRQENDIWYVQVSDEAERAMLFRSLVESDLEVTSVNTRSEDLGDLLEKLKDA